MSDLKGGPGSLLNGVRYGDLARLYKDVDGDGSHYAPEVYLGGSSITVTAGAADGATVTAASTAGAPVGGVYNDAIASATSGKFGIARITQKRAMHTNPRDAAGNEIFTAAAPGRVNPVGHSAGNFFANGNCAVKGSAGVLVRIIFNKKGAASNTLTVYDGTDALGTKLATFDTTDKVDTIECGITCATGIFGVLATGTSADVTFVYD